MIINTASLQLMKAKLVKLRTASKGGVVGMTLLIARDLSVAGIAF